MIKKIIVFLLLLAGIGAAAEYGGPQMAERGIYYSLGQRLNLEPGAVRVKADPGIKVLFGDLDAVTIHSDSFADGRLSFRSFDCDLRDVRFSPIRSLLDGRFRLLQAGSGTVSASVGSDDLRRFLTERVENLSDVSVDFADDGVHVTGKIKIGGLLTASADMAGQFAVVGDSLCFVPRDVRISAMGMAYQNDSMKKIEVYNFSDFPLGIKADRVVMEDGLLRIYGSIK